MKDPRFLPVEKREAVEDYDDYAEENSDELFIGGEADEDDDADELEPHSYGKSYGKKISKDTLYVAG